MKICMSCGLKNPWIGMALAAVLFSVVILGGKFLASLSNLS